MNPFPFEQRNYSLLTRMKSISNNSYGKKPEERTCKELLDYGLILLNKPQGPTSHQVADTVKKILNLNKVGHSGTLDPNVTGLLVITLGKSTRVVDALLKSGKEYICVMHIHELVEESKIKQVFKEYLGKIKQLPPRKSAVKRQLRTREIYYLEILEINGQDVLFKVGCEAGTYIRTLCVNIGKSLNTNAHMQELVRTRVGPFNYKNWISLHDLKDAFEDYKEGNEDSLKEIIHPFEEAVSHLPKVYVLDSAVDSLCHGAFLSTPGIAKLDSDIEMTDLIALMTLKDELIGLGVARMNSQDMLHQEKGLSVGNLRVFMERGTYPKFVRNP